MRASLSISTTGTNQWIINADAVLSECLGVAIETRMSKKRVCRERYQGAVTEAVIETVVERCTVICVPVNIYLQKIDRGATI